MVVVSRAARFVVLAALLWSVGCLAAAVNWHTSWMNLVGQGAGTSALALQAQERWQHWVDMTLVGVLVTVGALVLVVWQVLRAAGPVRVDRTPSESELLEIRGR